MAETVVQKELCEACGADVREGSLFCYNCGKSVIVEPANRAAASPEIASANTTSSTAERNNVGATRQFEQGSPNGLLAASGQKLQTAANLRKRARSRERLPVEVVWERPAGTGTLFVVVTLLLTLFAIVLLILAMYFR